MESGYAPGDGTEVYWEAQGGGGTPIVLVHGGYGTTGVVGKLAGALAAGRRVISVELRGHGHTRDTDAPFSWDSFGTDIAGVIRHLGDGPMDLLGLSLGGGASLRCAIGHPELVRRLVIVSAPCRRDAWFPEVLAAFDGMTSALFDMFRQGPMYTEYVKMAPDPGAFPALMDKTGDLLRQPYDWSSEVAALRMPTLLAYADADSIPPSHAAQFYGLLGGGLRDAGWDGTGRSAARLAILPGTTHYNIIDSPLLAQAVADFCAE